MILTFAAYQSYKAGGKSQQKYKQKSSEMLRDLYLSKKVFRFLLKLWIVCFERFDVVRDLWRATELRSDWMSRCQVVGERDTRLVPRKSLFFFVVFPLDDLRNCLVSKSDDDDDDRHL